MMYKSSRTSRSIVTEWSIGYKAPSGGQDHMTRAVREYLKVTEGEKIAVIVAMPMRMIVTFQEYADKLNREAIA